MVDSLIAGGAGKDGTLTLLSADGKPLLTTLVSDRPVPAKSAEVQIGTTDRIGLLTMNDKTATRTVRIDAEPASIRLGKPKGAGFQANSRQVILSGDDTNEQFVVTTSNDDTRLELGFPGRPGRFRVHGKEVSKTGAPVEITAGDGRLQLGRSGTNGRISLFNAAAEQRVDINAADGTFRIGGSGVNGTVSVVGADGQPLLELLGRATECVMGLGQGKRPGRISIFSGNQRESLRLDGSTGDIVFANADAAEYFDLAEEDVEPGSVMVLTDDGAVTVSERPYDTRVAGVVSGAGSFAPALVLDRRDTGSSRAPIALMGKVFCKAEGPIGVGDLLTTGGRPGHAMAITEPGRALGAVLGKALAPLKRGCDMIPVLVALQ
jgi:hypothetical protein